MSVLSYSRREFIAKNALNCAGMVIGAALPVTVSAEPVFSLEEEKVDETLKISVFDIDATPPIGSYLAYDQMKSSWDLGLRAKGIVLTGTGAPIVLCAIDWIGIANASQDVFKQTLADAVHTVPERVAVHTLHQHDAPVCDFSTEKMLKEMGIESRAYDGSFAREFLSRLGKAVKDSLNKPRTITDMSIGKAPVNEVASNRMIFKDGKVVATRYTACPDAALRSEPEGLIDPDVTLVGFWEGEKPVAVMTFYATHPQSYYRTGIPNPDFPGLARFFRQLTVPEALHIHFTGAGGNIGAGKYNDGSHKNRMILAGRLADGMERAWKNSTKIPLSAGAVSWKTESVALPVSDEMIRLTESQIQTTDMQSITNIASRMSWAKRAQAGNTIDIACLSVGKARVLFMPGELSVEYQLAAKAYRPDLAVSMAAYGEYGPSYICTKEAYSRGGYEVNSSPVTAESEEILMNVCRKLLS